MAAISKENLITQLLHNKIIRLDFIIITLITNLLLISIL